MAKILVVAATDTMCWVLLKPWLRALMAADHEVHIACSRGHDFPALAGFGFRMHDVRIRRTFNPLRHIGPLCKIFRLIRQNRYDIVNTHSPVAAAIGRVAAWAARWEDFTSHQKPNLAREVELTVLGADEEALPLVLVEDVRSLAPVLRVPDCDSASVGQMGDFHASTGAACAALEPAHPFEVGFHPPLLSLDVEPCFPSWLVSLRIS